MSIKEIFKGAFGASVSVGSVAVSKMDTLKECVQLASLIGGFVIVVLTIVSISLTIKWKIKHNQERQEDNE